MADFARARLARRAREDQCGDDGDHLLTLFIANNLIGWIGTFYEEMTPLSFWLMHAAIAAVGGILVLLFGPALRRILEPVETQGLRPAAMTREVER